MRENRLNNAEFGQRMVGSGPRASIIQQRFELACKRANIKVGRAFELDTTKFTAPIPGGQIGLFDDVSNDNV